MPKDNTPTPIEIWVIAALIVGFVIVLSIISTSISQYTVSTSKVYDIRTLVNESVQFHNASVQDNSPEFALKHAIEAIAMLNAALKIASPSQIEQITKISLTEYQNNLKKHYQSIVQRHGLDSSAFQSIIPLEPKPHKMKRIRKKAEHENF